MKNNITIDNMIETLFEVSHEFLETIMETPDDENITVSAGSLKKILHQHDTLLSYLLNDTEAIKRYLEQENLI